jgi:hypothetical protein
VLLRLARLAVTNTFSPQAAPLRALPEPVIDPAQTCRLTSTDDLSAPAVINAGRGAHWMHGSVTVSEVWGES